MSALPQSVGSILSPPLSTGLPPSRVASAQAGKFRTDGLAYCANFPVPPTEQDLMSVAGLNPPGEGVINPGQGVASIFGQGVVATVTFTIAQALVSNPGTYVILQGDNGDGNWFDICGCIWQGSGPVGTQVSFLLFSMPQGTPAVLQQTRTPGTQPAANFFNPTPPLGRYRFVGKGSAQGSGSGTSVLVSIFYRLPPLR